MGREDQGLNGPYDVFGEPAVDVHPHSPALGRDVRPATFDVSRVCRRVDVPERGLAPDRARLDTGPDSVDGAGCFVAGDAREAVCAEGALLHEQIRAARAARLDLDSDLAGAGLRQWELYELERLSDRRVLHGPHAASITGE